MALKKVLTKAFLLIFITSNICTPLIPLARAATPTSTSTQPSSASTSSSDSQQACADVADGQGDKAAGTTGGASSNPQMKKHYCDAARNEDKAGGKNKAFGAVYIAVGAICLVACINKLQSTMLEKVCKYSFIGASISEGIFTKSFLGPIMGVMPLFMGGVSKSAAPGTTKSSADGDSPELVKRGIDPTKKGLNKSACISCAMAFALAAMKFLSANKSKDNAEDLYTEAAKFPSVNTANITTSSTSGSGQTGSDTGGGGSSGTTTSSSGSSGSNNQTASNLPGGTLPAGDASTIRDPNTSPAPVSSSDACVNGSTDQILSCAIAADPGLRETISNPDFGRAFQEASGIPLGDFLKNPGKDIGESFGKATGNLGANAEPLQSTLQQLADPKLNLEGIGSEYSGGGGGAGGGKSNDGSDAGLADAFKNLMSGLGGASGNAQRNPASDKSLYAGGREPSFDEVFKNTKISLFDRVSRRVQKRTPGTLEVLPPSTPLNRSMGGFY